MCGLDGQGSGIQTRLTADSVLSVITRPYITNIKIVKDGVGNRKGVFCFIIPGNSIKDQMWVQSSLSRERETERMSGGQKNTEDIVFSKRHHELRTATTTATATATN